MRLGTIDLKNISITQGFWKKHVDLVKDTLIPYQWQVMNGLIPDAEPSKALENIKIAAGLKKGEYYGAVFQDTDVAKWLEAVGFTLAAGRDEELEKTADDVIHLIGMAQQEDGYLNSYFTIVAPERRWKDLCEGHELYTAGHMMEAAVAYYLGTGKDRFLDIMKRNADLICDTFGNEEGKIHGYPGHQEVEIGLIKMYHATGEKKYLDTAMYFIDARGTGEHYFLKEMKQPGYQLLFPEFERYDPSYSQSHLPVREQKTAEGHAVRAVYMYAAMAELAWEYADKELLGACETLWDNIVQKRMYITGGIGSSGILERFTADYDLPNDASYCETCASVGLAMFGIRMFHITRESKYIDVVERALYNTLLAGIALDGRSFFYVNPLEVWPPGCKDRTSKEHVKAVRQKWFGVACCPPNITRTLASMGQYIYSVSQKELYINLFIASKAWICMNGQDIKGEIITEFPNDNGIRIRLENIPDTGIMLAVRIPDYAKEYAVAVKGEEYIYSIERGYAVVEIMEDCEVVVTFTSSAKFVRAHPNVRADAGKVALVRGPQVYCLEEVDNGPNLSAVCADTDSEIREFITDKFGGIAELSFKGRRWKEKSFKACELYSDCRAEYEAIELTAIPYAYWCNRGGGEMAVWMREYTQR